LGQPIQQDGGDNDDHNDNDHNDDVPDWERKRRDDLYKSYLAFEKKHGDREGIEQVLSTRQRAQYNQRVTQDPHDYDAWFEFAKLEEESGDADAVRDVYERAVAQIPPSSNQKDHWRRYIFLWIYYATYEELTNHDLERASQVYQTCLSVIPHKQLTFCKIWVYAAKLYIRKKDLPAARKLLGRAIGVCGKETIFKEYIAMELSLGEIDRCRALYNNYLKAMPHNCNAWSKYAELEKSLGETERCRAIFELAVNQPALDMPEVLWKGYIDFEIDEGEANHARKLYERLLDRTSHVKVWISYAQFEATQIGQGMPSARHTFEKAYAHLKEQGLNEERVLLLDAWRVLEQQQGDAATVTNVEQKLPRRVKRKRMRKDDNGNDLGWEEYFDYQFPDDQGAASSNLKILEMAAKWKKQQEEDDSDDDDDDDDEEMEDE
jgi:crooked neck